MNLAPELQTAGAPTFEQRIENIERCVQQLEQSSDPAASSAAREMVRSLLDLHAVGVGKLIGLLSDAGDEGHKMLQSWTEDELVSNLLILHDLHLDSLETRVETALENVRPYLNSHGGNVALEEIVNGAVRLRIKGSCQGCPSSQQTIKSTIERAIRHAAPEATSIEVVGIDETPANLIQIETLSN